MNKESTFRKDTNDYLTHTREEKGITLIALVITIIVLLILAGIAITMLTGDNSILQKAGQAKETYSHSVIFESMQLSYSDYITEKTVNNTSITLIQFLQNKEIIGDMTEDGWYVIDTVKLTGSKQPYGNGTDEKTDVYVLEKDGETANVSSVEIASTTPIRIADNSSSTEEKYKVVYHGAEGSTGINLGELKDTVKTASNEGMFEFDATTGTILGFSDNLDIDYYVDGSRKRLTCVDGSSRGLYRYCYPSVY